MKAKITIEIELPLFPSHYPEETPIETILQNEINYATKYPDKFISNIIGYCVCTVKGVLI